MPVQKFRDARDMPRPPRVTGDDLAGRIAAVWARAASLTTLGYPPGVYRFRSIEEAQQARLEVQRQRIARTAAERAGAETE